MEETTSSFYGAYYSPFKIDTFVVPKLKEGYFSTMGSERKRQKMVFLGRKEKGKKVLSRGIWESEFERIYLCWWAVDCAQIGAHRMNVTTAVIIIRLLYSLFWLVGV